MRKVMVLTLVLLMALAGSAMAEVVWSGEFEATGSSNSFKVFQDDYELKATVTLSAKGTAKSETEIEGEEDEEPTTNLNWEFTGGINLGLDDERQTRSFSRQVPTQPVRPILQGMGMGQRARTQR